MKKIISPSIASSILLGSIAAFSVGIESSSAATTQLSVVIPEAKNSCSGVFGNPFDECDIGNVFDGVEISPIIAKFEFNDSGAVTGTQINTKYDTVDGSEFTIVPDTTTPGVNGADGLFTYTRNNVDDPYMRYWAEKAGQPDKGGGVKLNFYVATTETLAGGSCTAGNVLTVDCVQKAVTINSFSWDSPKADSISNLAIFNTEDPIEPPGDGPSDGPEPITLLASVFGLGFAFKLNNQYSEEE